MVRLFLSNVPMTEGLDNWKAQFNYRAASEINKDVEKEIIVIIGHR